MDPDGDPLSVRWLASSIGTGHTTSDGYVWTPPTDYNGPATVSYKDVWDPSSACSPAVVSITVVPVNDPPIPADDVLSGTEKTLR